MLCGWGRWWMSLYDDDFSVQYNIYKIKQNFIRPPTKYTYPHTTVQHIPNEIQKPVRKRGAWFGQWQGRVAVRSAEMWYTHWSSSAARKRLRKKKCTRNISIRAVIKYFRCTMHMHIFGTGSILRFRYAIIIRHFHNFHFILFRNVSCKANKLKPLKTHLTYCSKNYIQLELLL